LDIGLGQEIWTHVHLWANNTTMITAGVSVLSERRLIHC